MAAFFQISCLARRSVLELSNRQLLQRGFSTTSRTLRELSKSKQKADG